jgi:hypothetical protein
MLALVIIINTIEPCKKTQVLLSISFSQASTQFAYMKTQPHINTKNLFSTMGLV